MQTIASSLQLFAMQTIAFSYPQQAGPLCIAIAYRYHLPMIMRCCQTAYISCKLQHKYPFQQVFHLIDKKAHVSSEIGDNTDHIVDQRDQEGNMEVSLQQLTYFCG